MSGTEGAAPAAKPTASAVRSAARASFEAAKKKGAEKAAEGLDVAKAKAAEGAEIAKAQAEVARAQAAQLAKENEEVIRANVATARQIGQDVQEMSALPAPALQAVAASTAARAEAQYAQSKAMIDRNHEAAMAMKASAERAALDAKAQATALGNEAMARGEQMASVAVDIARGEFENRWQKVLEQEAKLTALAAEVERREKQMSLLRSRTEPNWPPRCCCIEPMVHHDIENDIPPERQTFVKRAYANYFYTVFMLIANCAVALAMLTLSNKTDPATQKEKKSDPRVLQHFIVSIVFLLGTVFSFIVWYWPIYKALGTGVSSQYLAAFVGLFVAFFFNLLCILGPIGYGGCGIMYAMEVRDTKSDNAFIPVIIVALMWILQSIYFIYMIWRLRRHQRQDKASLAKAKAEMFASNLIPGM